MIFGNVSISDRWRSGRDGPLGSQRCGGAEDPKSANPNRTWQQLSVLAHNVIRSFQLDTLPAPKPRSRKRTYFYLLRSMRTLRFLVIARAPGAWRGSGAATSSALARTRPPSCSIDGSIMPRPRELSLDLG